MLWGAVMNEKVLFYIGILFSIFVVINLLSFYSNDERYVPNDPEKKEFGHKSRMKFISKLTCGQVTARLWTDSYGPFDCRFGKEGDNYTFTIHKMICMGGAPGRATYKVIIMPEQEGSIVYFFIMDYRASQYALDIFAWELKKFLEKKLEAVRVE